jgi:hypothetical protein
MSKFPLIPYSVLPNKNFNFNVEINQNADAFFISFLLAGDLSLIDFGDSTPKKTRTMKLWEKTCFELFLKNSRDEYLEFNFSPSFEWNNFYFEKKGNPVVPFEKMQRPETDILLSIEKFFLVAEIKKEFFPENFNTLNKMSAGISAVLKLKNNENSYWALSHEDSKPNFHHFDSFKYKF